MANFVYAVFRNKLRKSLITVISFTLKNIVKITKLMVKPTVAIEQTIEDGQDEQDSNLDSGEDIGEMLGRSLTKYQRINRQSIDTTRKRHVTPDDWQPNFFKMVPRSRLGKKNATATMIVKVHKFGVRSNAIHSPPPLPPTSATNSLPVPVSANVKVVSKDVPETAPVKSSLFTENVTAKVPEIPSLTPIFKNVVRRPSADKVMADTLEKDNYYFCCVEETTEYFSCPETTDADYFSISEWSSCSSCDEDDSDLRPVKPIN